MRQVVLDTETTGLSPSQGHRLIEIGCVEILNRRLTGKTFQVYLQPDREIDAGAIGVHGITNAFLEGKPRFKDIVEEFKAFIKGSELIIHNAPFDVGFIENEFKLIKHKDWVILEDHCQITDTLIMARKKHPGQRNNLDALCKRYNINNQHRHKHGALLDAEILADLYLTMTGGQNALSLEESVSAVIANSANEISDFVEKNELPIIFANEEELAAHLQFLDKISKKADKVLFKEMLLSGAEIED